MVETAIADTAPTNVAPAQSATNPAASNGKTAIADTFREHSADDATIADNVRSFTKARHSASAALAGAEGLAILGSPRGAVADRLSG